MRIIISQIEGEGQDIKTGKFAEPIAVELKQQPV